MVANGFFMTVLEPAEGLLMAQVFLMTVFLTFRTWFADFRGVEVTLKEVA